MGNKVCRFIATGRSYGAGKIRITREGYETDDAREIEFLRKSPDYGVFFYEVATSRDLEEERLKDALALLTAAGLYPPPVVAPVMEGDAAAEQAAVEEQQMIRAEQEAAEEAEKAARRAEAAAQKAEYKAKKGTK